MRVNYLLPPASWELPVGGYKVHYQYANGLAGRGHEVTVLHPVSLTPARDSDEERERRLWIDGLQRPWASQVRWHRIAETVRFLVVPDLSSKNVPPADVTLATAWQTASFARELPPSRGRRAMVVFDYEFWQGGSERVRRDVEEALRSGLPLIATSPSVERMIRSAGRTPVGLVPCGLDAEEFGVDVPIERRHSALIGFPVRSEAAKGTEDALEALTRVYQRLGGKLRARALVRDWHGSLPGWIERVRVPDTAALRLYYNDLAIFVHPSHHEGWGLPGMEAMACGAALVCTDSVGNRLYARDGETARVLAPSHPERLADAVVELVEQYADRWRLARAGAEAVAEFTVERSVARLEGLLG